MVYDFWDEEQKKKKRMYSPDSTLDYGSLGGFIARQKQQQNVQPVFQPEYNQNFDINTTIAPIKATTKPVEPNYTRTATKQTTKPTDFVPLVSNFKAPVYTANMFGGSGKGEVKRLTNLSSVLGAPTAKQYGQGAASEFFNLPISRNEVNMAVPNIKPKIDPIINPIIPEGYMVNPRSGLIWNSQINDPIGNGKSTKLLLSSNIIIPTAGNKNMDGLTGEVNFYDRDPNPQYTPDYDPKQASDILKRAGLPDIYDPNYRNALGSNQNAILGNDTRWTIEQFDKAIWLRDQKITNPKTGVTLEPRNYAEYKPLNWNFNKNTDGSYPEGTYHLDNDGYPVDAKGNQLYNSAQKAALEGAIQDEYVRKIQALSMTPDAAGVIGGYVPVDLMSAYDKTLVKPEHYVTVYGYENSGLYDEDDAALVNAQTGYLKLAAGDVAEAKQTESDKALKEKSDLEMDINKSTKVINDIAASEKELAQKQYESDVKTNTSAGNKEIYGSDAWKAYENDLKSLQSQVADTWKAPGYKPAEGKVEPIVTPKESPTGGGANAPVDKAPAVAVDPASIVGSAAYLAKELERMKAYAAPQRDWHNQQEQLQQAARPQRPTKSTQIGRYGNVKKPVSGGDGWDRLLSGKLTVSKQIKKTVVKTPIKTNDGWDRLLAQPKSVKPKRNVITPIKTYDGWDRFLKNDPVSKPIGAFGKKTVSNNDGWDKILDAPKSNNKKQKSKSVKTTDGWDNILKNDPVAKSVGALGKPKKPRKDAWDNLIDNPKDVPKQSMKKQKRMNYGI